LLSRYGSNEDESGGKQEFLHAEKLSRGHTYYRRSSKGCFHQISVLQALIKSLL
jgi:hypothetical protein